MILDLINELIFKTSRSSGAGGQHVNKTESRVELLWDIPNSQILTDDNKQLLLSRLRSRLTKDGVLILASESQRSQHQNKQDVIKRFEKLIEESLIKPKKRIRTKPSRASKELRLRNKRIRSEIKRDRGRVTEY